MANTEKGYLVQLKSPEGENVYPVIPPEAIVKSDGSTYDFDSLFTSVSNGKALVASAITDKGVKTAADATYQQMAENISKMSSSVSTTEIATEDISVGDIVSPVNVFLSANQYAGYGTFALSDGYISAQLTARPTISQFIDGSSEEHDVATMSISGSSRQYQVIPIDDFSFMYATLNNSICSVDLYTRSALGEVFTQADSTSVSNVSSVPQIVTKNRYAMLTTSGTAYLNVSGSKLSVESSTTSITAIYPSRGDFRGTLYTDGTGRSANIKCIDESGSVEEKTLYFSSPLSDVSTRFNNGRYALISSKGGRCVIIDMIAKAIISETDIPKISGYMFVPIPINDKYIVGMISTRGLGIIVQVWDYVNSKFASNPVSLYPQKGSSDNYMYTINAYDSSISEIKKDIFEIKLIHDCVSGSNTVSGGFSRFIFDQKNHRLIVVDPLKMINNDMMLGFSSSIGIVKNISGNKADVGWH